MSWDPFLIFFLNKVLVGPMNNYSLYREKVWNMWTMMGGKVKFYDLKKRKMKKEKKKRAENVNTVDVDTQMRIQMQKYTQNMVYYLRI